MCFFPATMMTVGPCGGGGDIDFIRRLQVGSWPGREARAGSPALASPPHPASLQPPPNLASFSLPPSTFLMLPLLPLIRLARLPLTPSYRQHAWMRLAQGHAARPTSSGGSSTAPLTPVPCALSGDIVVGESGPGEGPDKTRAMAEERCVLFRSCVARLCRHGKRYAGRFLLSIEPCLLWSLRFCHRAQQHLALPRTACTCLANTETCSFSVVTNRTELRSALETVYRL